MLLTLSEIIELFPCRVVGDLPVEPIAGVSTDSRHLGAGELFVAIRGEKFDGHDFVHRVLKDGAAAALVDRAYFVTMTSTTEPVIVVDNTLAAYQEIARHYRQKMAPTVVALTGSAGKTTCKEYMHAVLSQKYNVHKNSKSFNNHIGVPTTLLQLQPEHEILVAELGTSNFGEISRLSYLVEPNVCVLLNIGYAHLEFLKSPTGVADAKMEIFDHAVKDNVAFYNGDDEILLTRDFPSTEIKTFGLSAGCDIKAGRISCDRNGCYRFSVDGTAFQLAIPGRHTIYNALAAIAVGVHFKVPIQEISAAVAGVTSAEHRMSVLRTAHNVIIDDAYNANPGSCHAALETLADVAGQGRRIAVLGDMLELGEFSQIEHEKLAFVAHKNNIDALFLCGAFSRHTAQRAQSMEFHDVKHFTDRDDLIDSLKKYIQQDDVILVKGSRSMHMEEVVNALIDESA